MTKEDMATVDKCIERAISEEFSFIKANVLAGMVERVLVRVHKECEERHNDS